MEVNRKLSCLTTMALLIILVAIVLAFVIAMFFSLDRSRGDSPGISTHVSSQPFVDIEAEHPNSSMLERLSRSEVSSSGSQFPPALGIDRQYQNTHVNMKDRHPVLQYQFSHSQGIVPATLGDPIRIPDVAGPMGMYGDRSRIYDSLVIRPQAPPYRDSGPYRSLDSYKDSGSPGPYPGEPIGVPVPAGALKITSGIGMPGSLGYPGSGYVGSVDSLAPFLGVNTPWMRIGILTSANGKNEILNLYMQPIAPAQNLYQYQVQDKNGFLIMLDTRYLEDGDEVRHVIGKHGQGPWKVHIFSQNRYVWV